MEPPCESVTLSAAKLGEIHNIHNVQTTQHPLPVEGVTIPTNSQIRCSCCNFCDDLLIRKHKRYFLTAVRVHIYLWKITGRPIHITKSKLDSFDSETLYFSKRKRQHKNKKRTVTSQSYFKIIVYKICTSFSFFFSHAKHRSLADRKI